MLSEVQSKLLFSLGIGPPSKSNFSSFINFFKLESTSLLISSTFTALPYCFFMSDKGTKPFLKPGMLAVFEYFFKTLETLCS